jgi:hypothetical protein
MTVLQIVDMGLSAGILTDLHGSVCPNPKCELQAVFERQDGILGVLSASEIAHDVSVRTVCYRCERCRLRVSPLQQSPALSMRDHLEEAVYIWWMFVNGATLTLTCLHMNRKEDFVRKHWKQAAQICAYDAIRRQRLIRFMGDGVHTYVVEADESRMGKFKTLENGQLTHNHWVWLGVVARGDPTCIWLIEVGVTQSVELGRVPPMEKEIWEHVCLTIFPAAAKLVLMTDGAACYRIDYPKHCPAVVEHYRVNHSEHEWTRPEPSVMWNPATKETRFCLAGTQYLDSTWRRCKSMVPKGLCMQKPGDRVTKAVYVRAQQWRLMTEGTDRWGEFMKALRCYYDLGAKERAEVDGSQGCIPSRAMYDLHEDLNPANFYVIGRAVPLPPKNKTIPKACKGPPGDLQGGSQGNPKGPPRCPHRF